jgi:hypothetical protein
MNTKNNQEQLLVHIGILLLGILMCLLIAFVPKNNVGKQKGTNVKQQETKLNK